MCWLGRVSRAGYYRSWREQEPDAGELDLRDWIQKIYLDHPNYGYRRIQQELHQQGRTVNHKRVARLMRLDNLLAIRRRKFRPVTTEPDASLPVCLNLAPRMQLNGSNQLWVADITYVRLKREFVYVAVILDAWSRKVVGWCVRRWLRSDLALEALRKAIAARRPGPGLVHHSDRGTQYASGEYADLLRQHDIVASMSRAGNPYDNAVCESFMRTLKLEQIDCQKYETMEDLEKSIGNYIDGYYNRRRLHSALGYCSPDNYEQRSKSPATQLAATLSFPRHEEIYSDA